MRCTPSVCCYVRGMKFRYDVPLKSDYSLRRRFISHRQKSPLAVRSCYSAFQFASNSLSASYHTVSRQSCVVINKSPSCRVAEKSMLPSCNSTCDGIERYPGTKRPSVMHHLPAAVSVALAECD